MSNLAAVQEEIKNEDDGGYPAGENQVVYKVF